MKTGDFRFHNIEKKELAHIDVCVDGEVIRFIPESLLEKEREKVISIIGQERERITSEINNQIAEDEKSFCFVSRDWNLANGQLAELEILKTLLNK